MTCGPIFSESGARIGHDPCAEYERLRQERDALKEELSACTEHPGGCGYWREAARQREKELDRLNSLISHVLAEYDACDEFNRAYRADELINETLRGAVKGGE